MPADGGSPTRKYAVMYGDWGGSFNLVAPMESVHCSDTTLEALATELARLADGDSSAASLVYEEANSGSWIAISSNDEQVPDNVDWIYNRVRATDKVYISDSLRDLGVLEGVMRVLEGKDDEVTHVFNPDLSAILSRVKTGLCSQEQFEKGVVRILRCAKGHKIVAERFSRIRESRDLYPDILASSDSDVTRVYIHVNCAMTQEALNDKLLNIKRIAKAERREERWHPDPSGLPDINKFALFSVVPGGKISRKMVDYAARHGISLVPIEILESMTVKIKEGMSLEKLADELQPGIPLWT